MRGFHFLNIAGPETPSGGVRKIWDHANILAKAGMPATCGIVPRVTDSRPPPDRVLVVPDVLALEPPGRPWVALIQNGYYIDKSFPWDDPQLRAILVPSEYALRQVHDRLPAGPPFTPLVRFRSSITGRPYGEAPFRCGPYPRDKRIVYFSRKMPHETRELFAELAPDLEGWEVADLVGKTDAEIARLMSISSLFLSFCHQEGWPAPPAEALASGCRVIGFTGGGGNDFAKWFSPVIPGGDLPLFAEEVRRLLNEPYTSYERISKEMFSEYSREAELEAIPELYRRFL